MGSSPKGCRSINYNYQKQTSKQDLHHDVSMRLATAKIRNNLSTPEAMQIMKERNQLLKEWGTLSSCESLMCLRRSLKIPKINITMFQNKKQQPPPTKMAGAWTGTAVNHLSNIRIKAQNWITREHLISSPFFTSKMLYCMVRVKANERIFVHLQCSHVEQLGWFFTLQH